ncbi:mucoidy inhibitor MuiA family protein [Tichowtungia aerotolerans]|uniref:Mucoidy inhibitor MuiA family protein n=1 Tax=Tichowtungia aerotolerans TaxID=2697043 RepID=A0A6P1M5N3_9BACT|nr:mucoidy inhibitor MuiA family protein [Tichowtungia aerotolerans]QHI69352.1 mucoidy inhibitor MuiA family protein [Tichowtungia aerotolerans]
MKMWFIVLGIFAAAVGIRADIVADSTIKEVTVFRDRAAVTRIATVSLQAGSNRVRFENLPDRTAPHSLQAVGRGKAVLADVQFKAESFESIPDEARRALYARRDELQIRMTGLEDTLARLKKQKDFLDQISQKVTFTAAREGELELDPAKWDQMLTLYADRSAQYDSELRKTEADKTALRKELDKVEADIREAGYNANRKKILAELELLADQPGDVTVELTYMVSGPTWAPGYDVRVDTKAQKMAVSYYGNIRQSTGEDWNNVQLSLSTANPGLGGQHPELKPWRIDEQRPRTYGSSARLSKSRAPMKQMFEGSMDNVMALAEKAEFEPPPTMEVRKAEVESGAGAVVFVIRGDSSIAADNVSHRVSVSQDAFGVALRYSTVPKLSPVAYLKAKAVNHLNYPLLPGRANVFLNDSFITESSIELIAPQEEFWTFLGADEGVKVEHKLVKRYRSTEGLTGRTTRYQFVYEIELHNTHSVAEDVVVWDQIPMSGSENIEVKLVEPRIAKDSERIKINEDNFIEWHYVLKPNQKVTIPFEFYVDAPAGTDIDGLGNLNFSRQ